MQKLRLRWRLEIWREAAPSLPSLGLGLGLSLRPSPSERVLLRRSEVKGLDLADSCVHRSTDSNSSPRPVPPVGVLKSAFSRRRLIIGMVTQPFSENLFFFFFRQ